MRHVLPGEVAYRFCYPVFFLADACVNAAKPRATLISECMDPREVGPWILRERLSATEDYRIRSDSVACVKIKWSVSRRKSLFGEVERGLVDLTLDMRETWKQPGLSRRGSVERDGKQRTTS